MEVKVKLNNLRVAPRKSQEVINLIRGKSVGDARSLLQFAIKKSAGPVLKLLEGAVKTALNDFKIDGSDLYISKITVDEGPKLKRIFPMSRGRAYPIMKRTSHITLVLSERELKDNKKTGVKKRAKKDSSKFKIKNSKTI